MSTEPNVRTKRGAAMAYLQAVLTTMPTTCTTWPFHRMKSGYGTMRVEGRARCVHRFVCEWYHGPCPPGMQVRHTCNNGHLGCFTPRHLAWGTPVEQGWDKVARQEVAA